MTPMRHVNAAAAIIHHEGRILLVLKEGWDQFSLPITKIREADHGAVAETGGAAAARAVEEVPGTAPFTDPGLLLDCELLQISGRIGETGHYQVQVYNCEATSTQVADGTVERWLSPAEILDPATEDISPTARQIIAKLTESALDGGRQFPPVAVVPIRKSTASVAIIQRDGTRGPEWLAQFNPGWGRYFLVGGHEEPGETAVECMLRELREELAVVPDEITLSDDKMLQFTAWSTGAWQLTDYEIAAFPTLLSDAALKRIAGHAENRWLSAAEIQSERSSDGKLISPTMRAVLTAMNRLP